MPISSWPAWLTAQKKAAEQNFLLAQMPSKKDESWRYSEIHKFKPQEYIVSLPDQSGVKLSSEVIQLMNGYENVICFYNGQYLAAHSKQMNASDILISAMSELQQNEKELYLKKSFHRESNTKLGGLALDQIASFENGTIVKIGNDLNVKPVLILHLVGNLLDVPVQKPFRVAPRTWVEIGENSKSQIAILQLAANETVFSVNHAVDIHIKTGANVELGVAQWLGDESFSFLDAQISISRDASCIISDLTVSGRISRNDYAVLLNDIGANVDLRSLNVGQGKGYVDLSSSIRHIKGQTQSSQVSRGLYSDQSRGVFNGHLRIEQDAQLSNAKQMSQNILLSSEAEADAKPQLEVFADNVKANHGATVGQLNEEEKFYLMSRGIPEAFAQQLIVSGFAKSTFQNLKSEKIKSSLTSVYEAAQASFVGGVQ